MFERLAGPEGVDAVLAVVGSGSSDRTPRAEAPHHTAAPDCSWMVLAWITHPGSRVVVHDPLIGGAPRSLVIVRLRIWTPRRLLGEGIGG